MGRTLLADLPRMPRKTQLLVAVWTLGFFTVMGGVLFASAGRWDLPMFWAYLIVMMALSLIGLVRLYQVSPDLIEERLHPGPGERDQITIPAVVILMVTHWIISGLDVGRFHWSVRLPLALQFLALIGFGLGMGLLVWAMVVNRFFSSAVRIQADRGQHVITAGPYHYVRHPGYTGGLLFFLCSGLALGSLWSVLPMMISSLVIIWRTRLEDRMLLEELSGYVDYAARVPYRLLPGIW